MFYDLAASSWGQEELDAIQGVIESDRFTMGENVLRLEEEFAAYHGMKYGIMVNSGSSANLIATAAQFYKKQGALQRGDEVIVPALSWSTTYHPLHQYGLKLKIVDIDPDTLNIDVAQLEAALSPKTRMLVAVSILGNPADLATLRAFADKHNLLFMEDNCESLDASVNGKKTGTFGDVNTFSFFFSHHIATMEGGMILTNDEETAHLCKALRAHGWTRDLPKGSPVYDAKDDDFFEAYRFIVPGYNVRPIELSGAIGLQQLKKLPGFTEVRRQNWALFQKLLGDDPRFIIQQEKHGETSSFCFPIVLNPEHDIDRAKVFAALKAEQIGYRIVTGGNILRHDVIKYYDYEIVGGATPYTDRVHDHGFFVGNHPYDLTAQITKLANILDTACRA
jgi:CDP-6-deoxy-D-xylo-4-hexulose-3-dehydrase